MSESPAQKNRWAALRLALALAVLVGAGIFIIARMEAPSKDNAGWFDKSLEPARAYGAFYRKNPKGPQSEEDYLIDHSTSTYLIDPKGNLRLVYKMDQLANAEAMAGYMLCVLGLSQLKD